jgi:hypothetical protein
MCSSIKPFKAVMNRLFTFRTWQIRLPFGRTFLAALLFIPLIIGLLEAILRLVPVPAALFVPSVDRELNYPEIDIKFARLADLNREMKVNCFFIGSSMADFGLDPYLFNRQPEILGTRDPACFNMALKAMKPEVVARISPILASQYHPSLLIMGISPVDFTGGQVTIRKFVDAPWIQYHEGKPSTEGWWIENSQVYRYWLSFLKYRDPAYRADLKRQLSMIDHYGTQQEEQILRLYEVRRAVSFPKYSISEEDFNGFIQILNMNSPSLRVVVVEMPVHPDFLPYYIPGGSAGYDYQFLRPVQTILEDKGVTFIRTQPYMRDVVTPDGWKDELHLNRIGTEEFSRWLAEKLRGAL